MELLMELLNVDNITMKFGGLTAVNNFKLKFPRESLLD